MKNSLILAAIMASCSATSEIQCVDLQRVVSSTCPSNSFQQPFADPEEKRPYHVALENYENDQCVSLEFI